MNGELFHDALDLLDDDLIQEVDVLRRRRKSHAVGWAACIAACLCVAVLALASFLPRPAVDHLSSGGGSLIPPATIPKNDQNTFGEVLGDGGDILEGVSVYARMEIISWQEDGFVGLLAQELDGLSAGTKVTVRLEEPLDIPAGSMVRIRIVTRDGDILYADDVEWIERTE